jgi:hypothetical protein
MEPTAYQKSGDLSDITLDEALARAISLAGSLPAEVSLLDGTQVPLVDALSKHFGIDAKTAQEAIDRAKE